MERTKINDIFSIILIGATVGKSNIISRYVSGEFKENYEFKHEVVIKNKIIKFQDKVFEIRIYDCFYNKFIPTRIPIKRADAAIIVYDITNIESFDYAKELYCHVKSSLCGDNKIIALIGNKLDLVEAEVSERKVYHEIVNDYVSCVGISIFTECSAKYNINIEWFFNDLISRVYERDLKIKEQENIVYEKRQFERKNRKKKSIFCLN